MRLTKLKFSSNFREQEIGDLLLVGLEQQQVEEEAGGWRLHFPLWTRHRPLLDLHIEWTEQWSTC